MPYQVIVRQTTFWEFMGPSARTRVHFRAKKEFEFVEPCVADIRFADRHPLLTDYSCAWVELFVSSTAAEPSVLLERIDKAIRDTSDNWRALATYRDPQVALDVLTGGYGSLGRAPAPFVDAVSPTLGSAGVRFTEIPSRRPAGEIRAMMAGSNWVVARSFRVEELPLDELSQPIAREDVRSG